MPTSAVIAAQETPGTVDQVVRRVSTTAAGESMFVFL
jgi:hypothetical protein